MTRHRFFVSSPVVQGAFGELDEPQSRQVHTVLRLRPGNVIVVFDGTGVEGVAQLTETSRSNVTYKVETVETPDREPHIDLTVGLALLRGDRFDLAIQKMTEIGVKRIVPLEADRCVVAVRGSSGWNKRAARYRRIILEAMEQSERVTAVDLSTPVPLATFLGEQPVTALVERGAAAPLVATRFAENAALAIGPEGGWSEREFALIDERARQASLGGLILRAETAAIVAAGLVVQQHYSHGNRHGSNS